MSAFLTKVVTKCVCCNAENVACLEDVDGSFLPTCLKCYADGFGHGGVPCCFAEATHFVETVCLDGGWNPNAEERKVIAEAMKPYYPPPYDYSSCKECLLSDRENVS